MHPRRCAIRSPVRAYAVAHGEAFREEVARLLAESGIGPREAASKARAVQVAYNGALVTWAIHGEGTIDGVIDMLISVALPDL
jgi:hypothetical protein